MTGMTSAQDADKVTAARPIRVLLVEDDEDDYRLTRDLLQEIGGRRYVLDWVSSYDDAVEAIARQDHDVYLVDHRLGPHDGVELLGLPHLDDKPVILLTGLDDPDVDQRALEAGAADYLVKGRIDAPLLERAMRYAIQRKRSEEALRRAHDELERRVQERTTELRQKIAEQQRTERKFRALLESAPDATIMVDLEGRIVFANALTEETLGYKPDELIGQPVESLVPEPLQAAHVQHRAGYCKNPVARPMGVGLILHGVRKDGSPFPAEIRLSPLETDEGLMIACRIRDITERKRYEEALRQSEEKFRLLAESIPQLAWMARPDGHIYWYNQRWYDYTGTTLEQMEGWGWRSVHDPSELSKVLERWKASIATGEPLDMVFALKGKDGVLRPFLTRVMPLKDDQGRVLQWFGTNTDVSAIKEKEDALREADRRKDEFLAMLGHELRNPLAAIRNGLHVLILSKGNGDVATRMKEMLDKQVNNLTRMVDDLLDVSRITRGKIQLRKEKVELAKLLNHAVESARPLIDAQSHKLTVALPTRPVHLEADPTRLEQVVVNLLSNAAKYTKQGGYITLIAEQEGDEAVIRVRDNGIGIRADLLPRVFDLFVQSERALDRSQGGLGIGLTLVRRLVEMHGGRIEAYSEGPDRGSEFVARLPALPRADNAPDASSESASTDRSKLRVLVVEDSEDVALTLKMLLEFSGHDVRVVFDGPAALVAYRTYQPDVILLDIGLPGMNGYDVARQLRREPGNRRPFIMAVTGYGQDDDKRQSHEAGFDYHMTKPVDPDKLQNLISAMPSLVPT